MKIYSSYEYNTQLHQAPLMPQLKEELDERWVYSDVRFKKYLEKCLEHKLEPVRESEFFDRLEKYVSKNRFANANANVIIKPFVQDLIDKMRRSRVVAL